MFRRAARPAQHRFSTGPEPLLKKCRLPWRWDTPCAAFPAAGVAGLRFRSSSPAPVEAGLRIAGEDKIVPVVSRRRQTASRVCLLLSIAGLLCAGCVPRGPSGEVRFDFRGSQFDNAQLKLLDPGTSWLVVPEADGLRVVMPQAARVDEVGFGPRAGLRGDFEIAAAFEIIKLSSPATGYGIGPRIHITTATEDEQAATVARLRRVRERDIFSAHSARYVATERDPRERKHATATVPTSALAGKLVLRRTGTNLQYMAIDGEGEIPAEIRSAPFTDADVSSVRISLHRGGASTAGEVRWKEVVLRADEFVPPRGGRRGRWLLALGGLLTAVLLGISGWHYRGLRP